MLTQNPNQLDASDSYVSNQTLILQQKIHEYVNEKNKIYDNLLIFLENPDDDEENFQNLIDIINNQQQEEYIESFEQFLYLLTNIANHHHSDKIFFTKIFQILKYYQDQIKEMFSDIEIYNIFESNKKILLFLFEKKILNINYQIYLELVGKRENNGNQYCHFFYPIIKEFIGEKKIKYIEEELLLIDPDIFDHLVEKTHEGENDSYICSLIRKDSVEEFISYVNKANVDLTSKIKPSFFETNSFLIENTPTLIEYSAFFGAIQIFQYLRMNNVQLTPSLWRYAIHSKNAELIHLLESYKVVPPRNNFEECFMESIKCHHYNISEYIRENLIERTNNPNNLQYKDIICPFASNDYLRINKDIFSYILKYHNYKYFPSDFTDGYELYYLCCYNYHTLVNFFMGKKQIDISPYKSQKINIFIFIRVLFKKQLEKNSLKLSIGTCN